MDQPFIGQIQLFGFTFAPNGWAFCMGQLLSISSNSALFSLLGTIYGGNGTTTFALPDLRGRVAIGQGQGPGLPDYSMGQQAGSTSITLLQTNLPAHTHPFSVLATNADANSDEPIAGARLGVSNSNIYATAGAGNVALAPDTTGITGGNQPIGIMNPYLTLNYSIALVGIFPSRN